MKQFIALLFLSTVLFSSCQKSTINQPATTVSTDNLQTLSIDDGLLYHFKLDGDLLDYSGNNYNAGLQKGNERYVTGHEGDTSIKGMKFTKNMVLMAPNHFVFQKTDSFTVSIWYKVGAINNSGRLLSTEAPEGNFRIVMSLDGKPVVGFAGFSLSDTTTAKKQWVNLVYTYNNHVGALYHNGILVASGIGTDNEALSYGSLLGLGVKSDIAYDRFIGTMQDIRIYNRAITGDEITYLATH